ncbi:MAG: M1 family metallopeptidase [Flavobacteriales bacterium]
MHRKFLILKSILIISLAINAKAQPGPGYWQQEVKYDMEIEMNAEEHRFQGEQTLTYTNNSPDTLTKVFYHLYFNAFQPGSMMDVRSRTIEDPDSRVGSRISRLDKKEIGYHRIKSLKQIDKGLMSGKGKDLDYEVVGTILEVELAEPILPGASTTFKMKFESQVPVQIRRSGRDNKEGVEFSMSQWYPKLSEYDEHGWHADPYVGREFHGVWGDFDVTIHMDSSYVLGGSGELQNPREVGHGYAEASKVERPDSEKLTWHFKAKKVHDFMWGADPDYAHDIKKMEKGPELHFFYQTDTLVDHWKHLEKRIPKAFRYMNEHFGKYPYDTYAFVQGGDGGMEYPMSTLITGHRSKRSLVGVSVHELIHSWYQMVLASNENMYPWMDEGFTVFASNRVEGHMYDRGWKNPHKRSYRGYYEFARSDKSEPLSIHADAFNTNAAYWRTAYSKAPALLAQLSYVVGQETFMKGMRRYYREWQFKHPEPRDFKRIMEKESGMQLDWYFMYWINTTRKCDYAILESKKDGDRTEVVLKNRGKIPMPLDVEVTYTNGDKVTYYIPLVMMRAKKPKQDEGKRVVLKDWRWPYPEYEFTLPRPPSKVERIEIDPSRQLADIDRSDNHYPRRPGARMEGDSKK